LIIHEGKDKSVAKQHHSDKMAAAMRKRKQQVESIELPERGIANRCRWM